MLEKFTVSFVRERLKMFCSDSTLGVALPSGVVPTIVALSSGLIYVHNVCQACPMRR